MADLANEGRGGAVWGQLAARERAAGGPGATGPRGEHSGCVGPVCSGRAAQRALQPPPIASPQAGLTRPTHQSRQPGAFPPSGQTTGETAGTAILRPYRLAGQAGGRRGREARPQHLDLGCK